MSEVDNRTGEVREWRRQVFHEWSFSLTEDDLSSVCEKVKNRLSCDLLRYEAILYDGASVRFDDYEPFLKFLKEETSAKSRIASLIISGSKSKSEAIKVVFNRFILTALLAVDLEFQLATVSYGVVTPSEDQLKLFVGDIIEGRLQRIRQQGVPRILALVGSTLWIWFATAALFILGLYAYGILAWLEVPPRSDLALWVRDHNDLYYIFGTTGIIIIFALPWILRYLYPHAIFRIGWEIAYIERKEKLRWQVGWTVVVGLVGGVLLRLLLRVS